MCYAFLQNWPTQQEQLEWLHSLVRACTKTGLAGALNEQEHPNLFNWNGPVLGPLIKSFAFLIQPCPWTQSWEEKTHIDAFPAQGS